MNVLKYTFYFIVSIALKVVRVAELFDLQKEASKAKVLKWKTALSLKS